MWVVSNAVRKMMLCALIFTPSYSTAQETDLTGKLLIELNAVDAHNVAEGAACTLSFLVINGLEEDLEELVVETVLFDKSGKVDRLTLFDLGALPHARPRVRQFTVPGLACAHLAKILFNGVENCGAKGLQESTCASALQLRSRTDIEVIG